MPEFILDHGSPEAACEFNSLDAFTQNYVETMFWTDCNSDNEDGLADATFAELSPKALAEIIEDCTTFQANHRADLDAAYATGLYNEAQAGHDFWLTRNRHGAGFWDRGLGGIGKRLTNASHAYGSADLYRGDDGQIHLM